MANEDALHRLVTDFMLDTCQRTKLSQHAFELSLMRGCTATFPSNTNYFYSGSSVEFYIKPLLPCIGDFDIMLCFVEDLAVPAGYTLPAELPAQFSRTVFVYEIIDSHQPRYVYLKPSYILERNDSGCVTVAVKIEQSGDAPELLPRFDYQTMANFLNDPLFKQFHLHLCIKQTVLRHYPELFHSIAADPHGPTIECAVMGSLSAHTDLVSCLRCLDWPPQAADWPTRFRSHGAPDQKTIDTVVGNGCDLVGAVHPHCRQDEWMNKYQWRLSFSRAEVTLLNSWTPVQQIVYHMLRFVLKREVFSKTNDNDPDLPKLCNYHIKTLMLWECEQKPQSWWSEDPSLVKLCSSLLHKLSDWVTNKHCQQYFIRNCNLLDHFAEEASVNVCNRLKYLADSSFLIRWFVQNYICECVPDIVSALFDDATSSNKLHRAVNAVENWKVNTLPRELCKEYLAYEMVMLYRLHIYQPDITKTLIRLKALEKVDQSISDFFNAVVSLQVAYKIPISSLPEDLLELLLVIYDPLPAAFSDTASSIGESGVLLCISRAIKLATLSSVRSNALEMLHNEMSKAYLHHSFVYGQKNTHFTVHVLLAALYYKTGHYQTATDHCKQVLNECAGEQFGPRCIDAEYLPQIDDNVDAMLGLILLYQHVQQNALNSDRKLEPHAVGLSVFTTKLLARYLFTMCSAAVTTEVDTMQEFKEQLSQTNSPLLADILLFKSARTLLDKCTEQEPPIAEDRTGDAAKSASNSMDTTLLVTTLELVALEKLITVRQRMIRELQFPIVNEYEALHAYKCGLFEECLQFCRTNVDTLLRRGEVGHLYCLQYPEMLSLLDGELVSVVGIVRLVNPSSSDVLDVKCHPVNTILTLFLYLMVCCHKKGCTDSLHNTLSLICYVYNENLPAYRAYDQSVLFYDRLILKLIYRSLRLYIETCSNVQPYCTSAMLSNS